MAKLVSSIGEVNEGDYFESTLFHPCICIDASPTNPNIEGISLVDGTLHNCNQIHSGIRKLTLKEAIKWKFEGPQELDNIQLDKTKSWW